MRGLNGHLLMLSKATALILLLLLHATAGADVYYKDVKLRSCGSRDTHCVALRECANLQDKINYFGNSLKALQVVTDNICSLSQSTVNVCCKTKSKSVLQSTAVSERIFRHKVHQLYMKKKSLVNKSNCGRIVDKQVFGGEVDDIAQFKDFPWMAILMFQNGPVELKSMCGGTLVSDQYVLTAAHCADEKNNKLLKVRFGFQKENCHHCRDYSIKNIILHEDYDPDTLQNDIALLYLMKPIKEMEKIVPICLPISEVIENGGKFTRNTIFTAVRYEHKRSDNSTVPMKTHVVLQGDEYCSSNKYVMPYGQKCVKSSGICQGDSGSALVYPARVSGKRTQIKICQMGIISSGFSECAAGTPIRMISVTYYLAWILEKIGN